METSYKLPLEFNALKLREDLDRAMAENWQSHFVKIHYKKGWNGIALRSADGSSANLAPGAIYTDTPVLLQCSYFREVLSAFQCNLHRVRLLRLEAGTAIKEHIDPNSGRGQAEVRLHIPIITNNEIEFYSNRKRVIMRSGEVWFLDTSYPHAVFNKSNIDRIHLVIDCSPNDWLYSLFPSKFSQYGLYQIISYKIRALKFLSVDLWRAMQAKDRREFMKRLELLFRELGVWSLICWLKKLRFYIRKLLTKTKFV